MCWINSKLNNECGEHRPYTERLEAGIPAYTYTAPRGPAGALTADEQLAVDAFLSEMEYGLMVDYDDDLVVLFRALSKLAVNAAFDRPTSSRAARQRSRR